MIHPQNALLPGLILLSGFVADKAVVSGVHRAYINGFALEWHRNREDDNIGDILKIYKPHPHASKVGSKSNMELAYTYFASTYIGHVETWPASTRKAPRPNGILLTTYYSTGSGKEIVILAEINGKIQQIFKAFSDRAGKRNPLRMRRIAGATYPEIIFIPSYAKYWGVNPASIRADIWKWSGRLSRYIKVREIIQPERNHKEAAPRR